MSVCLQFFVRRAWLQVYQAGRGQGNRGSVPELFSVTSCLPHIIVSDNNTNHNGLDRRNNGDMAQPNDDRDNDPSYPVFHHKVFLAVTSSPG